MKNSEEILARARECVATELERRLTEATLRLPHRCLHNHRQPIPGQRVIDGEPNPYYNRIVEGGSTIGLCMLGSDNPEEWPGNICEDPIDAQRCPYFVPPESKDQVIRRYQDELSDPEWIQGHMPELAALLWVLDEASAPRLSWFRRLVLYFRKLEIEPLRLVTDPAKLLPPSE